MWQALSRGTASKKTTVTARVTQVGHERNVCDTSDTRETWATRKIHECDATATRTTREWHEWKISILITTRMKTYFHTPILAIWKMKHYEERKSFVTGTTFWKYLFPMPKCVWKVHHTPLCNGKSYIEMLCTRL